ncbi:hypothetical protein CR513_31960, partial [Mucuna pruriens]
MFKTLFQNIFKTLLSCFDFDIKHIKNRHNSLPDFLNQEFLQGIHMSDSIKISHTRYENRNIQFSKMKIQNILSPQD